MKLVFMHPDESRIIYFAKIDRMQPPKSFHEINEIIKALNVRYFIDLQTKLLN